MKFTEKLLLAPVTAFLLFSCASNNPVSPPAAEPEVPAEVQAAVPEAPVEEPVVEELDDEYKRSVSEIDISPEQFELDKRIIMSRIKSLDLIMEGRDFKKW